MMRRQMLATGEWPLAAQGMCLSSSCDPAEWQVPMSQLNGDSALLSDCNDCQLIIADCWLSASIRYAFGVTTRALSQSFARCCRRSLIFSVHSHCMFKACSPQKTRLSLATNSTATFISVSSVLPLCSPNQIMLLWLSSSSHYHHNQTATSSKSTSNFVLRCVTCTSDNCIYFTLLTRTTTRVVAQQIWSSQITNFKFLELKIFDILPNWETGIRQSATEWMLA